MCSGRMLREFDGAFGQQIEHDCAASRHGRPMGAAGAIHTPAGGMTVERGAAVKRHDQVDFAIRMHMMGTGDIVHMHDIDGKAVGIGQCLEDAPVANAARLAIGKPASTPARHASASSVYPSLPAAYSVFNHA